MVRLVLGMGDEVSGGERTYARYHNWNCTMAVGVMVGRGICINSLLSGEPEPDGAGGMRGEEGKSQSN